MSLSVISLGISAEKIIDSWHVSAAKILIFTYKMVTGGYIDLRLKRHHEFINFTRTPWTYSVPMQKSYKANNRVMEEMSIKMMLWMGIKNFIICHLRQKGETGWKMRVRNIQRLEEKTTALMYRWVKQKETWRKQEWSLKKKSPKHINVVRIINNSSSHLLNKHNHKCFVLNAFHPFKHSFECIL